MVNQILRGSSLAAIRVSDHPSGCWGQVIAPSAKVAAALNRAGSAGERDTQPAAPTTMPANTARSRSGCRMREVHSAAERLN